MSKPGEEAEGPGPGRTWRNGAGSRKGRVGGSEAQLGPQAAPCSEKWLEAWIPGGARRHDGLFQIVLETEELG